jgi:serine/threonine protein kinase/tetratricopeptide (TPR) repeat protein
MASRVGQHFGNYRLIHFLGRGGFAEVYLGEHVYLTTNAALKVLHTKLIHEQEEDFLHEARTIAHLEHPHIVPVLEFGIQDGTPFLVMRYAPHGTLRTAHPRGMQIPLETIVTYVKQVAAALHYAHERKLIHRDIKPENMLLGTHQEVLLSDFGLAVMTQSSEHQEFQHVGGTISYMAPEQLRGKSCLASDQYALGNVVYEWLCGTPPFVGSSLEVAMQHVTAPVPLLREKLPTLAPEVERVVLMALAKDPAQRFASITAFATALEKAFLTEELPQAEPFLSVLHAQTLPLPFFGRQHRSPLIGRTQEWERLQQLIWQTESSSQRLSADLPTAFLSSTTTSRPSCMILLGEAGIGKTRLAEELSQAAQRREWTVIWSRGYAQERDLPYRLWAECVRAVIQHELRLSQDGGLSPLLLQSFSALTVLIPELVDLLPQDRHIPPTSASQEQLRLYEGILTLFVTVSQRRPLLIILDDLHWSDSSSVELLSYLIRRLQGHRFLIVGTCRERDLPSTHPLSVLFATSEREQALTMLHLAPLTNTEIGKLVGHLSSPLTRHIQRYAAGNPFFAEELSRVPVPEGIASNGATPSSRHLSTSLPRTITALLEVRLSNVNSACQRLLVRAAVLGGSFALNTIRSMEAGEPDADDDTILDLLEEALHAGIITEENNGTHITYHFWHPLFVSYLYEGLSAGRRAILHHKAAEVLQHLYQGREQEGAAAIVNHLVKGGADSLQIAHFSELAGDRAYALSAYPEAMQHYQLVIEHGKTLHANASAEEHLHLAILLERLGECTRVQGNEQQARHYFEHALEVRKQYRFSALEFDHQDEAQIEALLWCEVGRTWFDTGDYEHAQHCYGRAEQVLREAKVAEDPTWATLYLRQSYILWHEGSFDHARQTAQHALRIFKHALRQQHHPIINALPSTATRRTLAGDPVDLGRTHKVLAVIAATLGQSTLALDQLNTALTIFERNDHQQEIASICGDMGDVYLRIGEHLQAQATLHRSLSIAERIGDPAIMSVAFANLGILAARLGDLAEAEACFKRALVLAEQVGDPVYMSLFQAFFTLVLQDQGQMIKARESVRQALRIGRVMKLMPCMGVALVVLGKLRLAQALAIQEENNRLTGIVTSPALSSYTRVLRKARSALQQALAFEGLEAETRTEGQLAMARVVFLLGEIEVSKQQALQVIKDVRCSGQTWLQGCVESLMGDILFAQDRVEQADQCYQHALQEFRAKGMRLEYARTLQKCGRALLQRSPLKSMEFQAGLNKLYKARALFIECQATPDLQVTECLLRAYDETSTQQKVLV